ncbi:LexA family protein [Leucobacter aridicollis]|uniref:LexA family protein n=1 Tax=Leucobacter aridicollis TaxID=283878 RepID=UPI00210359AF|nr:translesion error-prone DNA polymerase V autoproteolytic subunit [Leucobacter aridicollis]UTX53271.1 translesion error-prone DNA polymerase V autoproteolytic subunit [Leucobacter aridicollis]
MQVVEVRELRADAPSVVVAIAGVDAACGFPSPSQDYQTSEIDLNEHLMPNRLSTFVIRARGHSMTRAGIFDGDELIVDRSIRAQDGHVVIAVVDGEMTVKRLRIESGRAVLAAESSQYPDIEIPELSELHIWGVVTRSLHRVSRG